MFPETEARPGEGEQGGELFGQCRGADTCGHLSDVSEGRFGGSAWHIKELPGGLWDGSEGHREVGGRGGM